MLTVVGPLGFSVLGFKVEAASLRYRGWGFVFGV